MCGIYGILGKGTQAPDKALLANMGEAATHRGPDHTGVFADESVAMGINRLAILDPMKGNQPIFARDGQYSIVYNGEIYNHIDIRSGLEARGVRFKTDCDTETVLQAYCEYGPAFLDSLNGMFAFAIWDGRSRTLFLARDGFGIKPLYFCREKGLFAFASQPASLLPVLRGAGVDWKALVKYFLLGYLPFSDAAFQGVEKFPPGHYAILNANRFELRRYFQPTYGGSPEMQEGELRQELEDRMREAVRRELLSDVPLGVFLSGGLDSSAVALYASQVSERELTSYSLSFAEKTHDESHDAAMVARGLGLRHKTLHFDDDLLMKYFWRVAKQLDEPFADATVVPLLALSEFAREDVKVVLTGWGGDEVFAGYPTLKAHRLAETYKKLPPWLRESLIPAIVRRLPVSDKYMSFDFKAKRFIKGMEFPPEVQHLLWMSYFDFEELDRLFLPEVARELQPEAVAFASGLVTGDGDGDKYDRILRLDSKTFLEGNGLFQVDRMTMAASLEARVPLLNQDLACWVNALPAELKAPGGRPKELMRSVLRPHLPRRIIDKPKKGFGPPTSIWLRGPFASLMQEILSPASLTVHGVFDVAYIQRLIRDHLDRQADHGRKLWALLSFQLWYEHFVA